MKLEKRLRALKLVLGSYALFIVVAASFIRFSVPAAETLKIEDVTVEAKMKFLNALFNDITNVEDLIKEEVEAMHRRIISLMLFPVLKKNNTGVLESLQFGWNVFTTMGDARLDESKMLLAFAIGGVGIFIYLFNISEWAAFGISCIEKFNDTLFEKVIITDDEQNRLMVHYRRLEILREQHLQIHDTIVNDIMEPEQQYSWHRDPYRDYKYRTKVDLDRVLAGHSLHRNQATGCLLIPVVILAALGLGFIFWPLYGYATPAEGIHAGIAAALTLDPPQGPSVKWWQPLLTIPLATLAHILLFATVTQLSQDFFNFMAKSYCRHGIKS